MKKFRVSPETRERLEKNELLVKFNNGLYPLTLITFGPLTCWRGWMNDEGEVILKKNAGAQELEHFAELLLANQSLAASAA